MYLTVKDYLVPETVTDLVQWKCFFFWGVVVSGFPLPVDVTFILPELITGQFSFGCFFLFVLFGFLLLLLLLLLLFGLGFFVVAFGVLCLFSGHSPSDTLLEKYCYLHSFC